MIEHDCWRLEISLPQPSPFRQNPSPAKPGTPFTKGRLQISLLLPSPFRKGGWGIFLQYGCHFIRPACPACIFATPTVALFFSTPLIVNDFSHGNHGRGSIQSLMPPSQAGLLSALFSSCKIMSILSRKLCPYFCVLASPMPLICATFLIGSRYRSRSCTFVRTFCGACGRFVRYPSTTQCGHRPLY